MVIAQIMVIKAPVSNAVVIVRVIPEKENSFEAVGSDCFGLVIPHDAENQKTAGAN